MVPLCLAAILAEVFSDLGLAAFDEMGKAAGAGFIVVMKNQSPGYQFQFITLARFKLPARIAG
jgi:hypothetical protein